MKKGSLKIAICSLFVLMIVSTSSNVHAETMQPDSSIVYALAGWYGATASDGNKKVLQGHGNQVVMTVGTYNSNNSDWYCVTAPDGDFYLQNRVSPYELVNITRILQNNTYYNCRGYWYDSTTNGRDQRLKQAGPHLYLAYPLVSGTWYLQTSSSTIVNTCNVIFYTGGGVKAKWDVFNNTF